MDGFGDEAEIGCLMEIGRSGLGARLGSRFGGC